MNRLFSLVGVLVVLLINLGCHQQDSPVNSNPEFVKDHQSLSTYLLSRGIKVDTVSAITAACFSAPQAWHMVVNEGSIQVFEYPDHAEAEAAARLISPDGGSTHTCSFFWVAAPHFYKKETLIVLYVGNDAAVIAALEDIFGPQFAGR
jgi:hypothetical protein